MGVSFSCVKNSVTARCLMHFDTVESHPLWTEYNANHCLLSRTPRQTETQEITKFETRTYRLCESITFRTTLVHTLFSWIQRVLTYKALRNWREQRPNTQDDRDSSVTEAGRVNYTEMHRLVISFFITIRDWFDVGFQTEHNVFYEH